MAKEFAYTATGNKVSFDKLWYVLHDLHEFNYISDETYNDMSYWVWEYEYGRAMPSGKRFVSPYDGAEVTFVWLLDDLLQLYMLADNADMENRDPLEPIPVELMLQWMELPVNIGRWAIYQPWSNRIEPDNE